MKNPPFALLNLILFSLITAFSTSLNFAHFFTIFLAMLLRKNCLKKTISRLIFLNLFIFFIVLSALISHETNLAIFIFLRANLGLLFMLIVFCERDENFLPNAVLGLNLGHKFASLLFISISFINHLKNELAKRYTALKIRAFSPKMSLFVYKTYANILALLIISAYDKAQNMQKTMILRGFNGKFIFEYTKFRLNFIDFLFFVLIVLTLVFNIFHIGVCYELHP